MEDYLGWKFAIDLIGVIILIIYLSAGLPELIYLKIFFYITLVTINSIDEQLSDNLELHIYGYALYRLLKLEIVIIFIVFWLSGIFFAIDYHFYVNGGPYVGVANWLTSEPCTTGVTPAG